MGNGIRNYECGRNAGEELQPSLMSYQDRNRCFESEGRTNPCNTPGLLSSFHYSINVPINRIRVSERGPIILLAFIFVPPSMSPSYSTISVVWNSSTFFKMPDLG